MYIDGFLVPVPVANKEQYRAAAAAMWPLLKEHGALAQHECWGDRLPEGKTNSMHTAVLRKADETVVYGWIEWPSKEVRDRAWEAMNKDARMATMDMPFDGSRMLFGGFERLFSGER